MAMNFHLDGYIFMMGIFSAGRLNECTGRHALTSSCTWIVWPGMQDEAHKNPYPWNGDDPNMKSRYMFYWVYLQMNCCELSGPWAAFTLLSSHYSRVELLFPHKQNTFGSCQKSLLHKTVKKTAVLQKKPAEVQTLKTWNTKGLLRLIRPSKKYWGENLTKDKF